MKAISPQWLSAIGLAAGAFTTLSFVPQLAYTLKRRSADDISGVWLTAFIAGLVLWLTYGLLLPSGPIILANSATLLLTLPILLLKIYYRQRS